MSLDKLLFNLSPQVRWLLIIVIFTIIMVIDYLTPVQYTLMYFYLIPILIASSFLKPKISISITLLAATAGLCNLLFPIYVLQIPQLVFNRLLSAGLIILFAIGVTHYFQLAYTQWEKQRLENVAQLQTALPVWSAHTPWYFHPILMTVYKLAGCIFISLPCFMAVIQVLGHNELSITDVSILFFYTCIGIFLIIRIPSADSSGRVFHWFTVIVSSWLLILIQPHPIHNPILTFLLQCMQMVGLVLVFTCVLTLGKSFGAIAAVRQIKTTGVYSLVRHPLYLGESIFNLSVVLHHLHWLNVLIWLTLMACFVFRIHEEERVLRHEPAYVTYCKRVRYRLIPGVF